MKPIKAKLLEDLSIEQRLEVASRALCDITKEFALMELRFLGLIDKLESLLNKAEAKSWEKAIRQRMEDLRKDGVGNKSKMAAYKKSSR